MVAAIAAGLWYSKRGGESTSTPFQNMRATTQTSRGDVNFSALSADGRYLAYIAGTAGRSTLRVRQVATGSDVEILPLQNATLEFPSFSPDGNYLFYLKRLPEQPLYRTLVRVPSLGGSEEQKGFDVDSRVTFSPDAKRVCFVRGIPQENRFALFIRDLDKGTERELASVRRPEAIAGSPSWSPDGKRIAVFTVTPAPAAKSTLVMFDAETGKRQDFFTKKDAFFVDVAWILDGRGLVAAGTVISEGIRDQVFVVTYPRGDLRRVTNDFDEYSEVAVSGGEGAIGALRTSQITNLYVADPADGSARRLTNATSPEHSAFGLQVVDDRVVFGAVNEHRLGISTLPFEGGEPQRITVGPGHAITVVARGNRAVFTRYDEDGQQHIWRVNLDGSGLAQITNGGGEGLLDVSNDGTRFTFIRVDSARGTWIGDVDGGQVSEVAPGSVLGVGFFSRDGRNVMVADFAPDAKGLVQTIFRVIPVTGGPEVTKFTQPPQAIDPSEGREGEWSFMNRDDPARNVYTMSFAGGAMHKLTNFTDGRLTDHEWSPDQRHIAVVRRDDAGENVWVVDANGGAAKQITKFDGQDVAQIKWTRDSKRVVVLSGTTSRDVVLITNFK